MDHQQKNDKIEKARGLGRKNKRGDRKGNQMTALRFQTGGRYATSPASLRGTPVVKMTTLIIDLKMTTLIIDNSFVGKKLLISISVQHQTVWSVSHSR